MDTSTAKSGVSMEPSAPQMDYAAFLNRKTQYGADSGFAPVWMPDFLFDFQQSLVEWAVRRGRAAIFADCGLGKTPMQLVWAENVIRKANKPVLIITPLAVSDQTLREADKFGIEAARSKTGAIPHGKKLIVTNYESLHHFNADEFTGAVCDESAAIKSFDGKRKALVTDFMRKMPYRLLCTATAAPNDYIELGTSSEALGELGYMDMLGRFFKNDQNSLHPTSGLGRWERGLLTTQNKWRFKKHAEEPFWRWVCSWARACRMPSDLGFDNADFVLPPLIERDTVVKAEKPMSGFLFEMPAVGLKEQREELRHSIRERCEKVAQMVEGDEAAVIWCHLNAEADLLEQLIPDARQVSGSQDDDLKGEIFGDFSSGRLRKLITKPKIGAWGLNWQHCARMTLFPSHSFEQYYQAVRRCWRFGQQRPVQVDVITTEGQKDVLSNLQRKSQAADRMFTSLVRYMDEARHINRGLYQERQVEVPAWL